MAKIYFRKFNSSGSVVGPAVDPTKFWRAVSTCLKNMRVHASHDLGYLPSPWPPQQPPAFVIRDVDVADLCLSRLVIGHFHGRPVMKRGPLFQETANRQVRWWVNQLVIKGFQCAITIHKRGSLLLGPWLLAHILVIIWVHLICLPHWVKGGTWHLQNMNCWHLLTL